jgi:glycosyltransferase involved in cell wall biosynthesis
MFTIIIPLYNKSAYIEKAIRSVLAQTYKEFELIVIDDGSKDESFAIAQQTLTSLFPQQFIPQSAGGGQGAIPSGGWGAVQQKNQGVSTARNNGVKLAKYDYIAFLDADDWWEPTYLEEMKGLIETYPEAGIYGSSYFKVKNGVNVPANIGVEKGFERGLINYCKVYAKTFYMPLWTGATIIKKLIYESENGFKLSLKLGEDFDLWIRVALKYPVAFLNKPMAYYNQDVEVADRGVVFNKLYKPATHFIFNLDYLSEQEKTNPDLHKLLDLLRVYTLIRYRLQKTYTIEVKKEIDKVDFSKQPISIRLQYTLPVSFIRAWNIIRQEMGKLYKKNRG